MSLHLNLSTGKFLNSSTLFKLSDALLLDVSSGEIVMSNLLVPRAGVDLFKLASLDLNFSQRKTLTDSVSGTNLITFSRASSGTYVGSDGLIKTSPVNLLTYSEQFDLGWSKNRVSISANVSASPDGALNADQVTVNSGGGYAYTTQAKSINSGSTTTLSVWAKYVNSQYIWLLGGVTPDAFAYFDLINGTVGSTNGYNCTITSNGNGWYRCSATITKTSATGVEEIGFGLTRTDNSPTDNAIGDSVYLWGAQLEEGTTASDYIPTTTTASGAPRFDHDPVTGESLGLLIEEARTNYIDNSNDLSQWNRPLFSPVFDANTTDTLSPDGTYNSTRITGGTNSGVARDNIVAASASTPYTASFFAKKGTADNVRVELGSGGNRVATNFNISTKTFSTSSAAGYFASFSTSYVDYPNGWVRVIVSGTTDGSASSNIGLSLYGVTNGATYFWGAQVEAGSFPTSYIPTTGSTVTRAADVASIEGTNFSSWYNQSEGTVFTEVAAKGVSGIDAAFAIGSAIGSNADGDRWLQQYFQSSSVFYEYEQGPPPAHPYTVGSFIKSAIGRSQGDNAVGLNGSIVQSDTYSGNYNPVFLKIGVSGDTTRIFNGHISRLAYFPTRKTDQELIDLTT